jgi:sigma-B regulation protein RsbU (phosphoserine phosphatase)
VDGRGARSLETDAGLPLGNSEGRYDECVVDMTPRSRFVVFSDGVTEAMNASQEQYGEARLRAHVVTPSATVQSVVTDVRSHGAGQPSSDDITVVMIETHE